MIRTIVTAAIIAIAATTASADKCGLMCKLAYGSHAAGGVSKEEAKASWENEQREKARVELNAKGEEAIVSGNYIYILVDDTVSMTPVSEVRGKSKDQIRNIVGEDIAEAIASGRSNKDIAADIANSIDKFTNDNVKPVWQDAIDDVAGAEDALSKLIDERTAHATAITEAINDNHEIRNEVFAATGGDCSTDKWGC